MKRFLIAAMALLMCMGAFAGTGFELTFGPNYTYMSDAHAGNSDGLDFKNDVGFTLMADFPMTEHFSFNPAVTTNWNTVRSRWYQAEGELDYTFYVADFDLRFTFNPESKVEFYAVAGVSYIWADYEGYGTRKKIAGNIGAGLDWDFSDKWSMTFEGKYRRNPGSLWPKEFDAQNFNSWGALLGITYRF